MDINPLDILFSQRNINSKFRDYGNVYETIDGLIKGEIRPDEIPKIRCCYINNKLHSLDN